MGGLFTEDLTHVQGRGHGPYLKFESRVTKPVVNQEKVASNIFLCRAQSRGVREYYIISRVVVSLMPDSRRRWTVGKWDCSHGLLKKPILLGIWLPQSGEHTTLDLGVMSPSPTLGVEIA